MFVAFEAAAQKIVKLRAVSVFVNLALQNFKHVFLP